MVTDGRVMIVGTMITNRKGQMIRTIIIKWATDGRGTMTGTTITN